MVCLHNQRSELVYVFIVINLLYDRAIPFGTVCFVEEQFEEDWAAVVR